MNLGAIFFVVGVPATWAALATFVGTQTASSGVARPILGLAATSAAIGLVASLAMRADDVTTDRLIIGVCIASALTWLVSLAYFALGRKLGEQSSALILAFVLSLVPLAALFVLGSIYVAMFAACGPDSYECPI